MLSSIAIILGYQVVGELISRLSGLPVPGPVIGMVLMLLSFLVKDNLINRVRPSAGVLLANLSLLFVPAGVGIMRHGQRFLNEGVAIMIAACRLHRHRNDCHGLRDHSDAEMAQAFRRRLT